MNHNHASQTRPNPRNRALALAFAAGLSLAHSSSAPAAVSPAGQLSAARYGHAAVLLPAGRVLVIGGQGLGGALASAELYDPALNSWSSAGGLQAPARFPTATLLANGKVLVAGGVNDNGPVNQVQLYDPVTGFWSPAFPLLNARYWHTATLLPNGRVLVAGGIGSIGSLSNAEIYDPASGAWTSINPMITARHLHTATPLPNGQVLFATGTTGSGPATQAEVFNPATGTWTAVTPMPTARNTTTSSVLPDGTVLVAGGYRNSYRSSIDIFDPIQGAWRSGPAMSARHGYHTATVLPNGDVMVAAGQDDIGTIGWLEVYRPADARWSVPVQLTTPRQLHTATLLPDGRVLLAAGHNSAFTAMASAELWSTNGTVFAANTALALAVEDPALTWVSGGDAVFSRVTTTAHDGVDAAESGLVADSEESWLQTSVNGPGTLTFWWKVSSEADFDWFRFQLDGILQDQISGEINWQQRSYPIGSGPHLLRWRFVKDSNSPAGQDRAWLDEVHFSPAFGAPVMATQPRSSTAWPGARVTVSAVALGAAPLSQQWYYNTTNLLPGATNASLALAPLSPAQAGQYHLVAANAQGAVTSSVVTVSITTNAAVSQVLLFSDSLVASPFETALTNLAQPFQRFSLESSFNSAVSAANRSSTLVIVDAPQQAYAFSTLAGFVAGGGRVLIQAYSLAASPTLAATFQVAVENRSLDPLPLRDWGGSPLFLNLPSPVVFGEIGLFEDAQRLHALPGALPVAGFTSLAVPAEAGLVIGNSGRTLVNGFYAEGALTASNAVRLAQNEIGFLIGALGAPGFVTQPPDQYVSLGANANLGVVTVGARPLAHQWRKNGQSIPGATGTNLLITGVQSNHFGAYDVIVSNALGSITSRLATLSLGIPPVIVQQPLNQSVVTGATATFSIEISGEPPPFTFEWRRLTAPTFTNVIVSNDRRSFLSLSNVSPALAGNYRVIVRNPVLPAGVLSTNATLTIAADSDGDGLPDTWESEFQLGDASADDDGDGLTNLEEYNAGSNPTNATSHLRLQGMLTNHQATLLFDASSNKTYSVQAADAVGGSWTRVVDVAARTTNHSVSVSDPAAAPQRYYRVVTPRQP